MKPARTLWTPMLIALLAALAACANPADNKTEARVEEAQPAQAPAREGKVYRIAETSKIEFTGSKVTGSHEGGFRKFSGEILIVGDDPAASRVGVIIDTTSLWADNEKLTGHLKSPDFFDVQTYPGARFESTEIKKVGSGYEITGNLDLHGVTKSITFPATIEISPDKVKASGEFFLHRLDFGIVYPGQADDLIRDEVVIRLDLEAVPAAAA